MIEGGSRFQTELNFPFGAKSLLFHFTQSKSALRILESDKFYLSEFRNSNDIKELITFSHALEDEYEKLRFLSFSVPNSMRSPLRNGPMWSHYGDKFRGCCLVFDKDKLRTLFKKHYPEAKASEIKYCDKFREIQEDYNKGNVLDYILCKQDGWSYEQEYRFVSFVSEVDNWKTWEKNGGQIKFFLPNIRSALKYICLGDNTYANKYHYIDINKFGKKNDIPVFALSQAPIDGRLSLIRPPYGIQNMADDASQNSSTSHANKLLGQLKILFRGKYDAFLLEHDPPCFHSRHMASQIADLMLTCSTKGEVKMSTLNFTAIEEDLFWKSWESGLFHVDYDLDDRSAIKDIVIWLSSDGKEAYKLRTHYFLREWRALKALIKFAIDVII